jgi:hypothetical protein
MSVKETRFAEVVLAHVIWGRVPEEALGSRKRALLAHGSELKVHVYGAFSGNVRADCTNKPMKIKTTLATPAMRAAQIDRAMKRKKFIAAVAVRFDFYDGEVLTGS